MSLFPQLIKCHRGDHQFPEIEFQMFTLDNFWSVLLSIFTLHMHVRLSRYLHSHRTSITHKKNEHQFQHRPTETSKNYVTINSELQKNTHSCNFLFLTTKITKENNTRRKTLRNIFGIHFIIYTNKDIFENKIIKIIM